MTRVAKSDLALIGDGAGDAERLQADTDCLRGVGGRSAALAQRNRAAKRVCPDGVFKCNVNISFDL